MPPRKYAPDDPKARHNLASKEHVARNRNKRRCYERELRARHKAVNSKARQARLAQGAKYRSDNADSIRAKREAMAARKWEREKAKLLADPDRHAAEKAKRARAARFKKSGLPFELFEIREIARQIKLKINELRGPEKAII